MEIKEKSMFFYKSAAVAAVGGVGGGAKLIFADSICSEEYIFQFSQIGQYLLCFPPEQPKSLINPPPPLW